MQADPLGRFFVTTDAAGRIALWDVKGGRAPKIVNTDDRQGLVVWRPPGGAE